MRDCTGDLAGFARGAFAGIYEYLFWLMHGILLVILPRILNIQF
jgi:hypothetical protein